MDNKKIANYERKFIGGTVEVYKYYNQNNSKSIDILISKDSSNNDVLTCATIGLSSVDINKIADEKKVRVELIALTNSKKVMVENIISSCAFEIMDMKDCYYGMIIHNVVGGYIQNKDMKHVLLMSPIFWNKYAPLEEDDTIVTWLLLVPIADSELEYIEKYGLDKFEQLLVEKKVDISDYNRTAII